MQRQLLGPCSAVAALALAACAAPLVPGVDAGAAAGVADRVDAGPRACVRSACDFAGAWQVTNTAVQGPTLQYCGSSTQGPLQLSADGGTVCMTGASDGSSDGGCEATFIVERNGFDWSGEERWELRLLDAGVLDGRWKVKMYFPNCTSDYAIHCVR